MSGWWVGGKFSDGTLVLFQSAPGIIWCIMAARGRGRGRGRGGGPGAQFLPRDDDGNIVFNKKQDGPPPLFPVSMHFIFRVACF